MTLETFQDPYRVRVFETTDRDQRYYLLQYNGQPACIAFDLSAFTRLPKWIQMA